MIWGAESAPSLAARCQASFMPTAFTQTTDLLASGGDFGVAQHARPPAFADPVGGQPRFAVGGAVKSQFPANRKVRAV